MNNPQRLIDRFLALSGTGAIQTDKDTALLNAEIDTRHRCEISQTEIVLRNESRDCNGRDLMDETIRTRGLRFTFTYNEVTPQILSLWAAYFFGAISSPVGTPANESQTLTRTGTVTGGNFKLRMELEGRIVTTKPIAWNATNLDIIDKLTAARMIFIQPGDVALSGTWATAITVSFPNTGRLGRANLPMLQVIQDAEATLTGTTPGITAAQVTPGAQNYHQGFRSVANDKVRFTFALGWEPVTTRVEKYVGFVCESFSPRLERRQNVGLTVSVVGPWDPDIEAAFTIPACQNITPLLTDDCKVTINGSWETPDISTENYTLNDNVPTDESSAYGFDDVDIQDLERGDQPTYSIEAGIFGSEQDVIYDLAADERTADPVSYTTHFGQPGNRFSLISTRTKIKFQDQRMTSAGALRKSVIQITGTPYKNGVTPPIAWEAYLDQSTAFLT